MRTIDLSFRELEIFCKVVELESFSKAAEAVFLAGDSKETDGKSQEDFIMLLGNDKNKTIVIYCGFVKCTRSHNGAAWVVKLGYKNVYRHPGVIFAWKGAKYPVEKAE
jgi:rhodanese-related sulfurtransferase